jgi:hypothetical protein
MDLRTGDVDRSLTPTGTLREINVIDDDEPVVVEPVDGTDEVMFVPYSEYDSANPFAPALRRRRNRERNPVASSRWKHQSRRRMGTLAPRAGTRSREHRARPGHRRRTRTAAPSRSPGELPPGPPPLWRHPRFGLIRRDRLPLVAPTEGAWS